MPFHSKMYLFYQPGQRFFFPHFTFKQHSETTCWGQREKTGFFAWVLTLSSQTVFWSVGSGAVEADGDSSWVLSNPWLKPWSLNRPPSLTVTAVLELDASILSYGSEVHWWERKNVFTFLKSASGNCTFSSNTIKAQLDTQNNQGVQC